MGKENKVTIDQDGNLVVTLSDKLFEGLKETGANPNPPKTFKIPKSSYKKMMTGGKVKAKKMMGGGKAMPKKKMMYGSKVKPKTKMMYGSKVKKRK